MTPLAMAWVVATTSAFDYPGVGPSARASGCLDRGATMYVFVSEDRDGGPPTPIELYVSDEGPEPDGLPESIFCFDGTETDVRDVRGATACEAATFTCGGVEIGVWIGGSSNDVMDCSDATMPLLMFGGDGRDRLRGGPHGDYIHGGLQDDLIYGDPAISDPFGPEPVESTEGGRDFICGSQADVTNVSHGGPDADLVWGGPDPDEIHGGAGNDLLQGAVSDDLVFGDEGDDWVHGGDLHDLLNGGPGADVLHGGDGVDTFVGLDGSDRVWAFDSFPEYVDPSPGDDDVCFADEVEVGNTCDAYPPRTLCDGAFPYVVATEADDLPGHPADHAWLNWLALDGARGAHGPVYWPGTTTPAEHVQSLALSPADCQLYAVLEAPGGAQEIVTVGSQGSDGGHPTERWCVHRGNEADPAPRIVDVAFDAEGRLGALDAGAGWFQVVSRPVSGPCEDPGGLVREVGRSAAWAAEDEPSGPVGRRMAWDDPDGGFFLVLTAATGEGGFRDDATNMDAFHAPTGLSMSMETHIPLDNLSDWPFTVTSEDHVGTVFTVEPRPNLGGCTGDTYRMLKISRRGWAIAPWNKNGCDPAADAPCCAELDGRPTAITTPHYRTLDGTSDLGWFYASRAVAFARELTRTQQAARGAADGRFGDVLGRLQALEDGLVTGCSPIEVRLDIKIPGGVCPYDSCLQVFREADCGASPTAVLTGELENERLDSWELSADDWAITIHKACRPFDTGEIDPDPDKGGPIVYRFCAEVMSWFDTAWSPDAEPFHRE